MRGGAGRRFGLAAEMRWSKSRPARDMRSDGPCCAGGLVALRRHLAGKDARRGSAGQTYIQVTDHAADFILAHLGHAGLRERRVSSEIDLFKRVRDVQSN